MRVKNKEEVLQNEDIKNAVKKAEEEMGKEGRMLFRASGTEPLIRVMVEAKTEEMCKKYVDLVVNMIKEKGFEEN